MAHSKSYALVLGALVVSLLLSACGSATSGAGHTVNSVNNVKTVVGWPFVVSASQHWAVVNGYNQGDHATVAGATYALDFALCSSVTAQQTCDLSKGWDTASTDGQPVVSPVAGHVLYIDGHSGVDHGAADSACRTVGIQLTTTDNSYVILQLAHIERLKRYDAKSAPPSLPPDLEVGDPVTQGEHIGFVSAVSGGGCYNQSHHIHMELYTGSDTKRVPQPFTTSWTIAGCAFEQGSTHQGELVPCSQPSAATPTPTPSLSAPLNTVDWNNFSYQSSCAPGAVQVRNGMGVSNSVTITISQVTYGNLTNSAQDDAVISYLCVDTQSKLVPPVDATDENRVFVFTGNASAPVMLADLPSSTDFVSCAGLSGLYPDASSAVIDSGTLVISGPPVGAAGIDLTQTYKWNGQHFDVVSTACSQGGP